MTVTMHNHIGFSELMLKYFRRYVRYINSQIVQVRAPYSTSTVDLVIIFCSFFYDTKFP